MESFLKFYIFFNNIIYYYYLQVVILASSLLILKSVGEDRTTKYEYCYATSQDLIEEEK